MVTNENEFPHQRQQSHYAWLENLTSFIDNRQGKTLQCKQVAITSYGCGCTYNDRCRSKYFLHSVQALCLVYYSRKQIFSKSDITTLLAANTNKRYPRIDKHSAYFVYCPIGIRHEQQGWQHICRFAFLARIRASQFFLHKETKRHTGFSCPWRPN